MVRLSLLLSTLVGFASSAPALRAAPAAMPEPELKVAAGFEVTRVHAVSRDAEGSWVSVAADPRGRLYASDQYGALHEIVPGRGAGEETLVRPLQLPIGGVHGMAWVDDSLYAVVGQKAVQTTGLYRLRDADGDGALDHVELLRALEGDGEHGPHAVVAAPDGRSLFVLAGNATKLPALTRSRVPRLWAEDSLLEPLPALMGSETRGILPGGWICRTDREAKEWELVCVGLRNAYALACDARGELFTFDSDTELEINLPWYRPARLLHAVSGADFGWRRGALKLPAAAPESWPTLLPMGLGSPTAVLLAPGANLPARHRAALWVADWSYGKIFAVHLQPNGASFSAQREEIVSGTPLPVTSLCANPVDGALYFTTGGRRLQSALYRLRWVGTPGPAVSTPAPPPPEVAIRRELERFHGRTDPAAVDIAWPALRSSDASVRQAARAAVESQPVDEWHERALGEREPRTALAAWLALARSDARGSRGPLLEALRRQHLAGLDESLRGEWLRVLTLVFARGGNVDASLREAWAPVVGSLFPSGRHEEDSAALELLVFCGAPDAAAKGVAALRAAVTRQAQLDYAKALRVLDTGWTPELRRDFFEWHAQATSWRGGGSFGRFIERLREDALQAAPEGERGRWRDLIEAAAKKAERPDYSNTAGRSFVRAWTTDDLAMLVQRDVRKRDPLRGRKVFGAAGCFACHTVGGEGGALGPDLSGAARRFATRDLIEAIVEPSREVSDQYGTVDVRLRDGTKWSGRIVNLNEKGLQLAQNLADPSDLVRFAETDVAAIEPSRVSLMPAGLLNVFSEDEILDLLAFLRTAHGVGPIPPEPR